MRDSMVERVARAICRVQFGDETIHGDARCCQVGGIDGCCVASLMPESRAAIEAMREPNSKMINAGFDAANLHEERFGRGVKLIVCKKSYGAMIDAALSEEGT